MRTFTFGRLCVEIYNQWPAVFRPSRWNWIDFTFIHVAFELSPYKHSNEMTLGVLGVTAILAVCRTHQEALEGEEVTR